MGKFFRALFHLFDFPLAFQNSVYNTAPSYFSLLHKNKNEILTISSGDDTSKNVLQTGALQAVTTGDEVLLVCSEAINIPNIEEVNTGVTQKTSFRGFHGY